jgi:hypothetical protein
MNGINGGIDENQRTKSFGQLYEQIWANNNNNVNSVNSTQRSANQPQLHHNVQNQQQQQLQYQSHPHPASQQIQFAASVDDLNLKNLEISNGHFVPSSSNVQHHHNLNSHVSMSTHALNENKSGVNMNQHMRKFDFIDTSSTPSLVNGNGNYTNKVSRTNMQPLPSSLSTATIVSNGLNNNNNNNNGHKVLPISNRQVASNDILSNEYQSESNGKYIVLICSV